MTPPPIHITTAPTVTTASDSSVVVSWEVANGSGQTATHRVSVLAADGTEVASGETQSGDSAASVQINGLTPGCSYRYVVTSKINDDPGWSETVGNEGDPLTFTIAFAISNVAVNTDYTWVEDDTVHVCLNWQVEPAGLASSHAVFRNDDTWVATGTEASDGSGVVTALFDLARGDRWPVWVQSGVATANKDAPLIVEGLPLVTISDLLAVPLTPTNAVVSWSVDSHGTAISNVVSYWSGANPINTVTGDFSEGMVIAIVTNLTANTTYDFFVLSDSGLDANTTAGAFAMLYSNVVSKAWVRITNVPTRGEVDVATRSTTLSWGIENNSGVSVVNSVSYRWDTADDFGYGIASATSAPGQPQASVTISNLVSGAAYTFYANSAVDGHAGEAVYTYVSSGTFIVSSSELAPLPPIISISDVATNWVMGTIACVTWKVQKTNSGDFVSHYVIATAAGLPFTLTNAVIAEGFEDSQSNVTVLLSGLTPLQSYHYYAHSVIDSGPGHFATAANNGDFYTFTTTEAEEGGGSGSSGEPIITVTRTPTTNGVTGTAAWITWSVTTTTNCFASHHVIYRPNALPSSTNALVATGIDDGCGNVAALLSGLTPGHNIYYYVQSVVDFGTGHFATDCNAGQYYGFHVPETGADEIPPSPLMSGLRFSLSGYSVNDNAGVAVISVMRTGNTNSSSSVDYSTAGGSAVAGVDYVSTSGTLTFDPGETNKTFTIQILDNPGTLADTTLNMFLSNPQGPAAIGNQGAATLTIQHNGGTSPTGTCALEFGQSGFTVSENAGIATINVVRTGGSSGEVSVGYETAGGSAVANEDYTPTSGTLTFADGETNKTFTVTIIDNSYLNPRSAVNLALSAPAGGALLGGKSAAKIAILDDEVPEPLPPVEIVPSPEPPPSGQTPESPSAVSVQLGAFIEVTATDLPESATVSWNGSASGSIQAQSSGATARTDAYLAISPGETINFDLQLGGGGAASYAYGVNLLSSYLGGTILNGIGLDGINTFTSPGGEPLVYPSFVSVQALGVSSGAPAKSVICAKPEGTNAISEANLTASDYTTTITFDTSPSSGDVSICGAPQAFAFEWDGASTATLVPYGQMVQDANNKTQWTFHANEEPCTNKWPQARTVYIGVVPPGGIKETGASTILGLQTVTVKPVFQYLKDNSRENDAIQYVIWKYWYGSWDGCSGYVTYNFSFPDDLYGEVGKGPVGRRPVEIGPSALTTENICASVLLHERYHLFDPHVFDGNLRLYWSEQIAAKREWDAAPYTGLTILLKDNLEYLQVVSYNYHKFKKWVELEEQQQSQMQP